MDVYQYELPKARIANWPAAESGKRDTAKLLVVEGKKGGAFKLRDTVFSQLSNFLYPGDLLVLNDTAVMPRRFFSKRSSDDREVELLLVKPRETESCWEALARPMSKLRQGDSLLLGDGIAAIVLGRCANDRRLLVEISCNSGEGVEAELDRVGVMPIPPYIRGGRAEAKDREFYQTVYSNVPGSIAAPTAGLHFTDELLSKLDRSGVRIGFLTHHVGAASFQQTQENPEFRPEVERYLIPNDTAEKIEVVRSEGRRVVCVGTTGCRALESYALDQSKRTDCYIETDLYLTPGHDFKIVDSLITNFHQPGSTHMHLVSAFSGAEEIRLAYEHALSSDYRFLSYGDALLLAPGGVNDR